MAAFHQTIQPRWYFSSTDSLFHRMETPAYSLTLLKAIEDELFPTMDQIILIFFNLNDIYVMTKYKVDKGWNSHISEFILQGEKYDLFSYKKCFHSPIAKEIKDINSFQ